MGDLIYTLITGAVTGWLAGQLIRGRGFGILWNILIGIAGAVIGGWVLGLTGLAVTNWIGKVISGVLGAILLLWIISRFRSR